MSKPASNPSPGYGTTASAYVWKNPGQLVDRNGWPGDTQEETWRLNDPTSALTLNWNLIVIPADIKNALKAYMAYLIESFAPRTACGSFSHLRYAFDRLPGLTSAAALDYPVLERLLAQ